MHRLLQLQMLDAKSLVGGLRVISENSDVIALFLKLRPQPPLSVSSRDAARYSERKTAVLSRTTCLEHM